MRFEFRPISMDDMPKMYEWIFRPHVRQWWNDPYNGLEDITAEFTADSDFMLRAIASMDGREIGYFQAWWDTSPPGEVGIDLFLATKTDLGKGIGSAAIKAFCDHIFSTRDDIGVISIDPDPTNARAIGAYAKAGFRHVPGRSTSHIYLMILDRPDP